MFQITKLGVLPILVILWSFGNYANLVLGHGMMLDPPNRSSIWRSKEPELMEYNATENWADNELFCGGIENQHLQNGGLCGVCGDNFSDPVPRANEDGGIYGQGIIVRKYKSGDVIPIAINLTTSHWGYFEIRLCAKNDVESHLIESCYDKHLLEIISDSNKQAWIEKTREAAEAESNKLIKLEPTNSTVETPELPSTKKPVTKKPQKLKTNGDKITKFYVPIGISHPFEAPMQYEFKVRLPKGIRCENCVMRWQYTTGSNWGTCEDGTEARGCGPQETFRNCADIAIV